MGQCVLLARIQEGEVRQVQFCVWQTTIEGNDALAHLKEYLSHLVQGGRNLCAGCGQIRGLDTPMLTCSGCRVARFCSADHQKMGSKKAALGGSLWTGRHKDMCTVLGKWREVVNGGVAPDSCTADLVAFLQRENARCIQNAEEEPEAVLSQSTLKGMEEHSLLNVCSKLVQGEEEEGGGGGG